MAIGRPMPPLILDDSERETLERWVRRPKTTQVLALRARMILARAEGRSNTTVGTDLGVSDETVGKWRSRFLERRLDGLSDEPRSGRPHLARLRTATSLHRNLQAVGGPLLHRKGAGHWASTLIRRTGRWSCAWTRSPRFRPRTAPGRRCPCARARWSGAPAPRRHVPLRRVGRQDRQGDWPVPPPPPGRGVPQVPRCHRVRGARRVGRAPDCGQLRYPQDGADTELVRQAAPLPYPLHAHQRLLAEPGGALVWGCSPKSSCAVECTRAAANWRLPSTVTWTSPTKTPSPLSGPRPLTKSWPAWPAVANAL